MGCRFDIDSQNPVLSRDKIMPKSNPRILIVDDEHLIRNVLKIAFEMMGCQVDTAADGSLAYEFFLKHKHDIDMVILDMHMPEMEGREVFQKIRKANRKQKVMMISGNAGYEDWKDILAENITEFVSKPFSLSKITSKVENMIFA